LETKYLLLVEMLDFQWSLININKSQTPRVKVRMN
jgi:hypothetical protein